MRLTTTAMDRWPAIKSIKKISLARSTTAQNLSRWDEKFSCEIPPKAKHTQRVYISYHSELSSVNAGNHHNKHTTQKKNNINNFSEPFQKLFFTFLQSFDCFSIFRWIFHSLSEIDNFFYFIVWSLWIFFSLSGYLCQISPRARFFPSEIAKISQFDICITHRK